MKVEDRLLWIVLISLILTLFIGPLIQIPKKITVVHLGAGEAMKTLELKGKGK